MMSVIRPKLPLTDGGFPVSAPMLDEGFLKTGWLNRLYAAARRFSARRSVSLNRFLQRGVELVVRGTVGDVAAQVAPGSFGRQRKGGRVEPVVDGLVGGIEGTPGTRLGRWLLVLPSSRSPALRDIVMLIGRPARAVAIPASSQPPKIREASPLVRNVLPWPNGKSINAVHHQVVPDIDVGAAAVAGPAALILERHRFARADGGVRDAMRPHVVRLEQEAVRESAVYRNLQRVEVVVAVVFLQAEGTEAGQRALAGQRVDQVDRDLVEKMMALASRVADLEQPILR